jgi:hypothetical protein
LLRSESGAVRDRFAIGGKSIPMDVAQGDADEHVRVLADDNLSKWLIVLVICSGTVLSKFAVPGTGLPYNPNSGTGGNLPLGLFFTTLVAAFGMLKGRLEFRLDRALILAPFLCVAAVSALLNLSGRATWTSLALLVAIYSIYSLRLRPGAFDSYFPYRAFSNIACLVALAGVLQFALQRIIGVENAFWLDTRDSEAILVGFLAVQPISYGSYIMKSNGFFLLEASFLSQLAGLALIIELAYFGRISRTICLICALVVALSGTGLIIVFVLGPLVLLWRRESTLFIGLTIFAFLLLGLSEALHLDTLVARSEELSSTDSSGFARFVSIFYLLDLFTFNDALATIVGRGPGSVTEFIPVVNFQAHDPTWGKVAYEYGLIGLVFYLAMIIYVTSPAPFFARTSVWILFFFLGGNLLNHVAHAYMLALAAWLPAQNQLLAIPSRGRLGIDLPEGGWDQQES